jgi:hypothetical protein
MCNQAVSLVAAALEREGVSTIVLQFMREIAERVRPPRALVVPFRHGYPLDTPGDAARQHDVIRAGIRMLEDRSLAAPALAEYQRTFPETG